MSECLSCGACCAYFRVSFLSAELHPESFHTPDNRVEQLNAVYVAMKGTNQKNPRCECLQGDLKKLVTCSIYENRPSPCRELQIGDEKCNRARAAWGLPAL